MMIITFKPSKTGALRRYHSAELTCEAAGEYDVPEALAVQLCADFPGNFSLDGTFPPTAAEIEAEAAAKAEAEAKAAEEEAAAKAAESESEEGSGAKTAGKPEKNRAAKPPAKNK